MSRRGGPPAPLPVDGVLADITAALHNGPAVVVVAPPGSGKTTRVPPALLAAGFADAGQILLLQPRRLAARAVASRIADERGERAGDTVGWHVRFERRFGPRTRLLVMTGGMLTRRLQADPFLDGVSVVILDEFHERGVHTDLAVAMLRGLQQELRPELKIVIMSATLDPAPIAAFLGGAPVVEAAGRCFPVTVVHQAPAPERRVEAVVADAVVDVLGRTDAGHVLAFLPGVGEINRVAGLLRDRVTVPVNPLHGRMRLRDQSAVLQPTAPRTVVLATNIAESSVTLAGVRAVVDAGLARVSVHDPGLGIDVLRTVSCSVAAADQRAGRAGRTGPGLALRLWSETQHALRPAAHSPELERADLAEVVLFLADLGETPDGFGWWQAPPKAHIQRAQALLHMLGAMDKDGRITAVGRSLVALPVHPRVGMVVLTGRSLGLLHASATAAALVSERDPWGAPGVSGPADLLERIAAVDGGGGRGADPRAIEGVRRVRDQLIDVAQRARSVLPSREGTVVDALMAGFPDRVGMRRGAHDALLASGQGARFEGPMALGDAQYFVAVALSGGPRGLRVRAAAPVHTVPATWQTAVFWDPTANRVRTESQLQYGALVLGSRPLERNGAGTPAGDEAEALLLQIAQRAGADVVLRPSDAALALMARIAVLARLRPDQGVERVTLDSLLPQLVRGCRSMADLARADVGAAVLGALGHRFQSILNKHVPTHVGLPSGRRMALDYGDGSGPPVLAARIQKLFGLLDTPRVCGAPVQVQLLAPNRRPAQVTTDLRGFWTGSYQDVRKQLRGRYPKHSWPEDPLTAVAEHRPRRKG